MSESSEPKRSRYLIYVGLFFYIHICIFQIIYKYIFYQETHLRTNRELQIDNIKKTKAYIKNCQIKNNKKFRVNPEMY